MKKLLAVSIAMIAAAALSARAGDAKDAKTIYNTKCIECHGVKGDGTRIGRRFGVKDYSNSKVQAELKDDAAVKAIKEGMKDKDGNVVMKPVEGLSDSDITGLVAYMRTFAAKKK